MLSFPMYQREGGAVSPASLQLQPTRALQEGRHLPADSFLQKAGGDIKPKNPVQNLMLHMPPSSTEAVVLWCSLRHHFGQVQGVSSGFSMKPDSRASGSIARGLRTARPQQLPVHPRCTLQISMRTQFREL